MAILYSFEKFDTISHVIVRYSTMKPNQKPDPVAYGILVRLNSQNDTLMFNTL